MLKSWTNNSYHGGSDSGVAENSLDLTTNVFVNKNGSVIELAVAAGNISGVNITVWTFDADNETVAMKRVEFTPAELGKRYIVDITGGAVTVDDEGSFMDLATSNTVAGAVVGTTGQVKLVRFISASKWEFTIANT